MLLVGFLHHRLGSTDHNQLGRQWFGLLPLLAAFLLLLGMASIGLLGTNGFVAELLMLLGIMQVSPLALVALVG